MLGLAREGAGVGHGVVALGCSGVRAFGSGCRARVLMFGDWARVLDSRWSDFGLRVKVSGLGCNSFGVGVRVTACECSGDRVQLFG